MIFALVTFIFIVVVIIIVGVVFEWPEVFFVCGGNSREKVQELRSMLLELGR